MLKLTVTKMVLVHPSTPVANPEKKISHTSLFLTVDKVENEFQPAFAIKVHSINYELPSDAGSVFNGATYLVETPEQICRMIAKFKEAEFDAKHSRSLPGEYRQAPRQWLPFPAYVMIAEGSDKVEIRYA
jgi:hypothetical protein